jgi:hypothetical protein
VRFCRGVRSCGRCSFGRHGTERTDAVGCDFRLWRSLLPFYKAPASTDTVSTAASSPSRPRCVRRSSRSSSTCLLDGSPPCSRIERRTAARSRSSASMVSRSRTKPSVYGLPAATQVTLDWVSISAYLIS